MSLLKYFDEVGGVQHHGDLRWPKTGHEELTPFPFRNTAQVALTQAEIEAVEQIYDFKCKTFQLWVDEELAEYIEIKDRCANGWYKQNVCERQYIPEQRNWVVLLEWAQIYNEIPNGKVPAALRGPTAPTVASL